MFFFPSSAAQIQVAILVYLSSFPTLLRLLSADDDAILTLDKKPSLRDRRTGFVSGFPEPGCVIVIFTPTRLFIHSINIYYKHTIFLGKMP